MSSIASESAKKPLRVGVLLCDAVQFLDVSPVDLFGMLTPEYLKACCLPDAVVAMGQEIEFLYISGSEENEADATSFISLTANVGLHLTHTVANAGLVDIVLIPGPDPSYRVTSPVASFLNAHVEAQRTLLVICTGILPTIQSGILTGQRATAPLGILPHLRSQFTDIEWTERRWEVAEGGCIWTSGGVTNGIDMVAAYLKEKFDPKLAAIVCAMADVGDRKQEYDEKTKLAVKNIGF